MAGVAVVVVAVLAVLTVAADSLVLDRDETKPGGDADRPLPRIRRHHDEEAPPTVAEFGGERSASAGHGRWTYHRARQPPSGWPVAPKEKSAMPRPISLVAALFAFGVLGSPVAAQDGTREAGAPEFPVTPDPAECRAEAPSADELIAIWYQGDEARPPARSAAQAAGATVVPVRVGRSADAETVAGVTATVRAEFACRNAGDFARALAFYSDDRIQSLRPRSVDTPEDVHNFLEAPPEPRPAEERLHLLAVTDVAETENGRVAAFLVRDDPSSSPEGPETLLLYFVEGDDGWLIDEVIDFEVEEELDDAPAMPENDYERGPRWPSSRQGRSRSSSRTSRVPPSAGSSCPRPWPRPCDATTDC